MLWSNSLQSLNRKQRAPPLGSLGRLAASPAWPVDSGRACMLNMSEHRYDGAGFTMHNAPVSDYCTHTHTHPVLVLYLFSATLPVLAHECCSWSFCLCRYSMGPVCVCLNIKSERFKCYKKTIEAKEKTFMLAMVRPKEQSETIRPKALAAFGRIRKHLQRISNQPFNCLII